MSLRLVNKDRTHEVTICDTVFHIISMTITEKDLLIHNLTSMTQYIEKHPDENLSDRMLSLLCSAIVKIEGHEDKTVREVIDSLEDYIQLREIVKEVIMHCSLSKDEVKNLNSSLEQSIPEPTGNVEKPASLEDVPVSTQQNPEQG